LASLLFPRTSAMINGAGKYTVKTGELEVTICAKRAAAP
jgi:hypothetical protein